MGNAIPTRQVMMSVLGIGGGVLGREGEEMYVERECVYVWELGWVDWTKI